MAKMLKIGILLLLVATVVNSAPIGRNVLLRSILGVGGGTDGDQPKKETDETEANGAVTDGFRPPTTPASTRYTKEPAEVVKKAETTPSISDKAIKTLIGVDDKEN
ncbi:CLUMA_CG016143, isoform A [Clunio marinus]|uniref:CLUMA_CG016143, isoform A n=1 Tax=Clunio marinus TaxID=568069 RepID=A0A1J1IRX1_9DIPT|nr:CLUMA_CG016143, isoform A [Clunio marinus]